MTSPAPPRGTRPANRRELLRNVAADLFARRGYANVAIADITAAVNVGASALYRHYPGKADLLFDAIDHALVQTLAVLPESGAADLPEIVRVLAAQALDNRAAGVLMQREARNLAAADLAAIHRKRAQISRRLTAEIAARRPELSTDQAELLGICASDTLTSVSFHHLDLPRGQYLDLLTDLALRVARMTPPSDRSRPARARCTAPATRADQITDRAVDLFAARGYAEVSIDDIGAAVGIAGPSIYNHFGSKHAILVAAMRRGHADLRADLQAARSAGSDPAEVLRRLSDAYVDRALDRPALIAAMITEIVHLGTGADGRRAREVQRAYIGDWVALARANNPVDDPVVTRIKVQAAQMLANDVARTRRLRRTPGLRVTVREAAWLLQQ